MKIHHQLFRFGIVGVAAMAVHLAVVSLLVPAGLAPLLANVFAFIIAFQVSYYGHRNWTFRAKNQARASYPKLLAVSLVSFALNEGLYALLLRTALDYRISLVIVLIAVSAVTFIASKLWVFRRDFVS